MNGTGGLFLRHLMASKRLPDQMGARVNEA